MLKTRSPISSLHSYFMPMHEGKKTYKFLIEEKSEVQIWVTLKYQFNPKLDGNYAIILLRSE